MHVKTKPLSYLLGAEVIDVDLVHPISTALAQELRKTFLDYQILLFRDQRITPQQHITFTRIFGEPDMNLSVPDYRHPDYPQHPELLLLTNEKRGEKDSPSGKVGQQWHSDHSMTLHPTLASLLHAQKLPDIGGDTMFTNMYTAYDTLSPGLKTLLDSLMAVHDATKARHITGRDPDYLAARRNLTPPVAHPVVRVHSETGRKALYVSEMMTTRFLNMTEEESAPLLNYLYAQSVRPEFTYRHQWRQYDLLIWDNRCTMHLAMGNFDPGQVRRMHRTSVAGERSGYLV